MPDPLREPWITPDDYLAAERTAEVRHEYADGEVFAMGAVPFGTTRSR